MATIQATAFKLPVPATPRERKAFSAVNTDGIERIWHATAAKGSWQVDVEDWWVFDAGWTTTGEAPVTIPKRRTNPGNG